MQEDTRVEEHSVGAHLGNLFQYVAEMHGTGFEVVRESVQNAADKNAKNILVVINCQKSVIITYDDGDGASKDEIKKKFERIGLSLKLGDNEAMGQKGIGNLAAFSIGQTWELVTKDILAGGRLRAYRFNRSEFSKLEGIKFQSEDVPFKSVPGAGFPATTMLKIGDVDEGVLKQLGDKSMIEKTLREAFNAKLKARGISLRVSYINPKGHVSDFVVKPTRFRGTPLQMEDYETPHGIVTFEMYHSHEPLKDPAILVLHQGRYSVPLSNFFKLKMLPAELEPLFDEGYFEGEIRLGFCTLDANRTAFQHNVELRSFVGAIEGFATEVLRPLTERFKSADRQERLRRVADSVLKKMKQYLNKYPNLLSPMLKSLLIKEGDGEVEGDPDIQGIVRARKTRTPVSPDIMKKQRKVSKEGKPKSKAPLLHLRDGLTIQMVNPEAEEGFLWHSRMKDGIIQINAMNSDFSEAERRGQTILFNYMFLLLQKELTCASLPPNEARTFDNGFEKTFLTFWKATLIS